MFTKKIQIPGLLKLIMDLDKNIHLLQKDVNKYADSKTKELREQQKNRKIELKKLQQQIGQYQLANQKMQAHLKALDGKKKTVDTNMDFIKKTFHVFKR